MNNSLYIHVPSIEALTDTVTFARKIAREWSIPSPAQLKVSVFCLSDNKSPLVRDCLMRRETLGCSQNANSKMLFNELLNYIRIWTALRFDAAMSNDFAVITEYRKVFGEAFEDTRKGCGKGLFEVESAIHNMRECIEDCNTVFDRALSEGLSFFTKVLPRLGKLLDCCLHEDVDPDIFASCGFVISDRPVRRIFIGAHLGVEEMRVPLFLGELFRKFYSHHLVQYSGGSAYLQFRQDLAEDKTVTQENYEVRAKFADRGLHRAVEALKHIRQLCFVFYKLEVPFDKKVTSDLLDTFCNTDRSLPLAYSLRDDPVSKLTRYVKRPQYARYLERHLSPQKATDLGWSEGFARLVNESVLPLDGLALSLAKVARYIVRRVLGSVDPREIVGRHGPGAVATGEKGPNKATFTRIYRKLEVLYPFTEYFMYNMTHVSDDYESMQTRLSYQDSATAKVVFVPKDSRGPRLISCEPLEIQWIQQGLMRVLSDAIESDPLTRGRVNFVDQTINQEAAWRNSVTGAAATIDLKDASDRVSVALVELLFPDNWTEHLLAARSDATLLTDGRTVELRKFAPMGSATCFPVEALCFFALSVASVYLDGYPTGTPLPRRISRTAIRKAAGSILVYGDDLVIPVTNCHSVIQALEMFHLKVNTQKSYSTGLFRESCGVDAFAGFNVTPVRIKQTWDGQSSPSDATLPSYVAMSNSLYAKGYHWAAWEIERAIQRSLENSGRMLVPYTTRSNLNRLSFIRDHKGLYWTPVKEKVRNTKTGPKVLSYVVEPVVKRSSRAGWEEMLRCESNRSTHSSWDLNPNVWRAGRYAVPRSSRIVLRWMPYSHE